MSAMSDHRAGASDDARVLAESTVLLAHGAGNDFVVLVDPQDRAESLSAATVRRLCDRRRGLGGDGLIRVGGAPGAATFGDTDVAGAQVTMDYRNADGSLAEMCGNGIRVTARVALEYGLVEPSGTLQVATRAGVRAVDVALVDDTFHSACVDMDVPATDPSARHVDRRAIDGSVDAFALPDAGRDVDGGPPRWAGLSLGNPHVVGVVDDLDAVDLARLGPAVQSHAAFPNGVNVNLVEVVDDHHVRLRTWERGVGATLACGSGTCATVAALAARGDLVADDTRVRVQVDGGDLWVTTDEQGHLHMSGPAEVVGRVDLTPDFLASLSG